MGRSLVLRPQVLPEAVPQCASQVGLAPQRVLEQSLRLDEQVLVDGAGQVGVAVEKLLEGFPAPEASHFAAIWAPTKRTSSRLGRAPVGAS